MKKNDPLRDRVIAFTVSILKLAHSYANDRILYPVFNQVIRSSGSIGANLSEAHGANTKAGFVNFFHIALQSARETGYWLEVLQKYGIKETSEINKLVAELTEFERIIAASLKTLKNGQQ